MDTDTQRKETFAFLNTHNLGVLSTISEEAGELWGAAIYYTVDEDFNFYFLTHTESKKFRNLDTHPQAAMTITDESKLTTVQASGKITKLSVEKGYDLIYHKLAQVHSNKTYRWTPPVNKIHNKGKTALLKFTPNFLQLAHFRPDNHAGEDIVRII